MKMDLGLRRHLVVAIIASVIFGAGVIGALTLLPASPGPRLSNNFAFNEKAKWLRRSLADGNCDVVALGSSVALNSVDADTIARRWRRKVVNTAFWNMTAIDADNVVSTLLRKCRPKLVIMPTYHGDFGRTEWEYDWQKLERYVTAGLAVSISTYMKNMDISYYFLHSFDTLSPSYRGRRSYSSLYFDRSGGVMFACKDFNISPQRWEGYRNAQALPAMDPVKVAALAALARRLKQQGIPLIVARVPLRAAAEKALATPAMAKLWATVEDAVVTGGAVFSDGRDLIGYDDPLFADFAHLNACGARKWTSRLLDQHRDLIAASLQSRPD